MSAAFPHLLAPGRLGSMEVRNRILMSPMGDSRAEMDGSVSDRQVAYYAARARGGVGAIIVGSVSVAHPIGADAAHQIAASQDLHVPGLRRLADAVHVHGARLVAQLVHAATNARHDIAQGRPMLASSRPKREAPDRLSGMVTEAESAKMAAPFMAPGARASVDVATDDDIAQAIEWFAAAAQRCVNAGFDAIELHAGHGYLIDSFLSSAKNTRTDEWGGDVAGRSRFLCEIVRAVRARVDVPVWMRVNASEPHTEGGSTLADVLGVVALAEEAGIDAVHVSAYGNPMVGVGVTDSHTPHTPGNLVHLAESVKQHTELPVITVGRLEPEAAEAVLAEGRADFVAMGRKLLADPDLPNKLRDGRRDDVRPCIYQYRCIGNIFLNDGVACVSNAATAHGDEEAPPIAAAPRTVVVVGGGPAGMETARLLAAGGHQVTLVERNVELGGRLLVAGACDDTLESMRRWLIRQVEQSDVDIRLGCDLADLVSVISPDVVVDATGTAWPGLDPLTDWVRRGAGEGPVSGHVVLLGGDKPSLSMAALLRGRGHDVTVVEPSGVFGQALGLPGRFRLVADLEADGVTLVRELDDTSSVGATAIDMRRAGPVPVDAAATFPTATIHRVGDVSGSAGLEAAFRAARDLAFELAEQR